MTHDCTCNKCEKKFRSQKKDSTICYDCALKSFAGNSLPEEGDFNSALLVSGEMSDEDARLLQEDLESVDHSREEVAWRSMVEDDDGDVCPLCGGNWHHCFCDSKYND